MSVCLRSAIVNGTKRVYNVVMLALYGRCLRLNDVNVVFAVVCGDTLYLTTA